MNLLLYIVVFTLIGSVISLIGGILLLINRKFALKTSHFLTAFAAGALLATAFFDLLPEAAEHLEELGTEINIPLWTLGGILFFFLLERFIHHHQHYHHGKDHNQDFTGQKTTAVPLIIIGDTIHNFADGVAIAATFLISIPLGIMTALVVAAHEIPQEIGDFGLMLNKGLSRGKVLLVNLFSSLSAILGAILTYLYKDHIEQILPAILALTAGFFIYIASANLIPEIHNRDDKKMAFWETVMLFLGVIVVYLVMSALHDYTATNG